MARYFLELSYNGTRYNGWQIQPDAPTVQEELQKALSVLLSEPIEVVGAGRTDTGVHARYYVAHFDTGRCSKVEQTDFVYHLNCILSKDIAVSGVRRVADDAHARFDAFEREYKYYISLKKNPFCRETAAAFYLPLDIARMNEAAALLLKQDDFTSFAKLHSDTKTNRCKVVYAKWEKEGEFLVFTIRADRFLRNMVRAIVGSLIDVGKGKATVAGFEKIIFLKDRAAAGMPAPAEGLLLSDVKYPGSVEYMEKQI